MTQSTHPQRTDAPDLIQQHRVHVGDVIPQFCAGRQSDGSRYECTVQAAVLQHRPEGIHNAAADTPTRLQPLL